MTYREEEGRGRASLGSKLRRDDGQMTVELVAMIPVIIAIAAIAVNALLFFSECAAFDRVARNAIRIQAAAPAYGQDVQESCALVLATVEDSMRLAEKDYLEADVAASGSSGAKTTYKATLLFSPTLFGLGLKSSIFGVSLPRLEHSTELSVETYRPGMLF